MRFRPATRADVPAIVAMLADDELGRSREQVEGPLDPAYLAAFDEIEASPGDSLIVAVDAADEVVGCYQLTLVTGLSLRGRRRAIIEGVRVAGPRRGGGIGGVMIRDAIARARAAGCGTVQLTTNRIRVDAQRFYARLGFEPSHVGMKLDLDPAQDG